MLECLRVKNIAIIDKVEIPFRGGLNILSGETGTGKSIIIEAISLLLGGRANTDLIRGGCDEAQVEGLFDLSSSPKFLDRVVRLGFGTGVGGGASELLIKRVVSRSSRHRIYVNGELSTAAILQELCEGLVDLCGQHEHQSLLKAHTQLELLDRFGKLDTEAKAFKEAFELFQRLKKEMQTLEQSESEQLKRADFIRFQIDELKAVNLVIGEDESLQTQKALLQSAEARAQAATHARDLIDGNQGAENSESDKTGALELLKSAIQRLRLLSQLDQTIIPLCESLDGALSLTEEVAVSLSRYIEKTEADPAELESIQERLSLLTGLKRKYGATISDMLLTLVGLEKEYAGLQQNEVRLSTIKAEVEAALGVAKEHGGKLSRARKKAALKLASLVSSELIELNMKDAVFSVDVMVKGDPAEWTAYGADLVQFSVRTNRGEVSRPLSKIASGGELSRLMLAIRRVIAGGGGIGVYLFDEIDAGIGGQTAFQVGKKLKAVAAYNQVICITHLPQVASFADHHLCVRKLVQGDRTLAEIVELDKSDRKEELARMLGGPKLTRKSLDNAAELIGLATSSSG